MSQTQPSHWASLFPEMYYDIIARVIPGVSFIIGVVYILNKQILHGILIEKKINGQAIDPNYFILFILLLFSGYVVGLMLSVLGNFIGRISYWVQYTEIEKKYFNNFKSSNDLNLRSWIFEKISFRNDTKDMLEKEDGLEKEDLDIIFQPHHDYIKKEHPNAGLPKSQAESKLLMHLAVAFALLTLLQVVSLKLAIIKLPILIIFVLFVTLSYFFLQAKEALCVDIFFLSLFTFIGITIFSLIFFRSANHNLLILIGFAFIALFSLYASYKRNNRFLIRLFSLSLIELRKEK